MKAVEAMVGCKLTVIVLPIVIAPHKVVIVVFSPVIIVVVIVVKEFAVTAPFILEQKTETEYMYVQPSKQEQAHCMSPMPVVYLQNH